MIRIAVTLALALLLAACKEDSPRASHETSPAGIAYALLSLPGAEDVAIRVAWPSNWASRPDVNQAVPHIGTDLMLSGGTEGHTPGEAVELFGDLQATARLSARPGIVEGALIAPRDRIARAAAVAGAHLHAPALDRQWFARMRDGFAERQAQLHARSDVRGFSALRWAVLGDTPLRAALTQDRPERIRAVTLEEVARWHRQVFLRNGALVVIAGDLGADEAGALVDALLAGLPRGTPPAPVQYRADFTPRRILLHLPEAEASMLTFIAPLPPTVEGQEAEDLILFAALGGGEGSVLFDALRSELRATYGFRATPDGFSRTLRFLALSGQVETAKLAEAEQVLRSAYASFRQTGPRGALDELKAPYLANIANNSRDPASKSLAALYALLDGLEPELALKIDEEFARVSRESLLARLQEDFPAPEAFVVLAVSPDARALPGACVISAPEQARTCP